MNTRSNSMSTGDWPIYNCHIHTFTRRHTPRYFIKWVLSDGDAGRINWAKIPLYLFFLVLYFGILLLLAKLTISLSQRSDLWFLLGDSIAQFLQTLLAISAIVLLVILTVAAIFLLQVIIDLLRTIASAIRSQQTNVRLRELEQQMVQQQRRLIGSELVLNLLARLKRISPGLNDLFERMAFFIQIAGQRSQWAVLKQVELQYPRNTTTFVVLPMDMSFMNLGALETPIERQQEELLHLARATGGQIVPFYAADPRHPDIVERVKHNLALDKFRGIMIYPNLGYRPDDPQLLEVYQLCIKGNFPVVTHCSTGGIWRYGLTRQERRNNSEPENYRRILQMKGYRDLKLCLAHLGGAEEWVKHLQRRARRDEEAAWVRTIYNMIASGEFPNLYTDISHTVFTLKVEGLYVDLVDYLKVLLNTPRVREHVLFGSDYYMVERASVSEFEASLMLRSRLGEELYKQIAYTNPRVFLGIETPAVAPKRVRKKQSTRR